MQQNNVDEIDLRELILTLWRNKILVLICTLAFTLLSAAYAFLSAPTYQATSNILPPTPANFSAYNVVALSDDKLPTLDVEEAYRIFLRHLNSGALKLEFFEKYYIPIKASSLEPGISEREQLWLSFNAALSVSTPNIGSADFASVKLYDPDAKQASDWVNEYVTTAMQRASQQAVNTLESAIKGRIQRLTIDIASLRAAAEQDRLNRIARLKEDLVLAKAIDLKSPASQHNLIISYNKDTAYLRGSLALEAELALLEARTDNDPFIEDLSLMNEQLALLKTLQLSDAPLKLATIDSFAVAPETPIKPKKRFIILLGLLAGGMLGICMVLIRVWWKKGSNTR
ncbi:Wzz/FepE/Etk N-terminal domain-containing protein [Alcaligenes endophyticus]|uniref:Polysaccharide chain length determinant N-terminal domain-containing protein n=1 Tax=Alcaligenes endophyticus TaxID=1929088 RepID=A0ABT8EFV9_9BURK|nr:Wzz/FepE/Etk N-terminal domain-containing protein [Alcaligenes endophyticus]MCX5590198.1 Wzz/FepE/Etk N-terminal domain-containing protein [Alcaligenes endophyticus]MDN4120139.1 hypothetical protein [Alcaligenes endophyticus]